MKKDKRAIQSEKAIIEASIHTLLVNPSAGMSQIAVAAGVGRATLYRHFESRDALIQKLAFVCVEELEDATESLQHLSGRAAIEAEIDLTMPLADRFHFLMSLWHIAADNEVMKRICQEELDELATVIDQAKEAGEIALELPTVWLVSFYDSTLRVAWSLIASGDVTPDEAAEYAKRSFFRGCAKVL
ncbi:MAG: TetR/AcrR family transcriptional regulator [Ardenticatenaceae bacterium]